MGKPSSPRTYPPFDHRMVEPRSLLANIEDQRILKSIELLSKADLSQEIGIDRLATSLNLSASRFRHLFSNEVGVSPNSYIRMLRLCRARILLEQSFLRVKQVMQMVGYGDASHFVRDYKSFFSTTPSMTRNSAWLRTQPATASSTAKAGNE